METNNRLAIEDGLDEKTLIFAKLIRDADKCDIFRVFAQEDPVDTTGFSAEQVGQEAVSDVYMRAFWVITASKNRNEKPGWMSGSAFSAFSLI